MKRIDSGFVLIACAIACVAGIIAILWTYVPRTVDLRGRLVIEKATTQAERELGLGKRDALPRDHGMLFVFEKPDIYGFWMKDMRFPIDIIWIDHGVVKDVVGMNPPRTPFAVPDMHVPTVKADRVLEVNAGVAKEFGIEPGVHVVVPE